MLLKQSDVSHWLREILYHVSWRQACGVVSLGLVGKLLWNQYGILRHRRLPDHDLGLPILGHTLAIFRRSLEEWSMEMVKGRQAVLANFLFENAVMVSYPLYLERLHRAELDGKFKPQWPATLAGILGKNSIIVVPGGKGHQHHKRMRGKILANLGPRVVLDMAPDLLAMARQTLDELAEGTRKHGSAAFAPMATLFASRSSVMPITAGLNPEVQEQIEELLDILWEGVFSVPVNLGPLTAFGRAMGARRELSKIVTGIMESTGRSCKSIIFDLLRSSESGEAFTTEEVVDTTITLLIAGRITTADALPNLFVHLCEQPAWAKRIAQEPLEFSNIEADSATLRFVRESLRAAPPAGAFRRVCCDHAASVDLGEHGRIPPGCAISVHFRPFLQEGPGGFDPDRWTPEVVRERFLSFGGSQPHACIGQSFALLELQLFARVLCREYDFAALDPQPVVDVKKPMTLSFKDGLRVTVAHRPA